MLVGCQANKADITLENSTLEALSFQQLSEKIEKKDEFILLVSKSASDDDSVLMERTLTSYFRERDILPVYELKLDEQGDSIEETQNGYSKLQDIVPYFSGTLPQMFYYKDGEMVKTISGTTSEIGWQNFMIECKLIEGKQIEEKAISYTITEDNLEKTTMKKAADVFRNHENTFIYYAKSDRYNEAFSKKLSEVVKEKKYKVLLLKESDITIPDDKEGKQEADEAISLLNQHMNLSYSPALYCIRNGEVTEVLKDNVSKEEIQSWFAQIQ